MRFTYRRSSIRKTFRCFLILLTLVLFIFGIVSFVISYKYDISPYVSGKSVLRHTALSTIYLFLQIYDPCLIKKVSVGPEDFGKSIDWKEYERIEDLIDTFGEDKKIILKNFHNEKIIESRFHFNYQPYDEPRLAELRNEYKLDKVVASAKNEFEAMVLLRNWTRSRFRRNDFQPQMENFDALKILTRDIRNRHDEPYKSDQFRPCHFFPLLYSQIMLSMGFQVRIVRISNLPHGGHGITEVWSNQYRKWITMDADVNSHFEKDGIPQNLLEVHNERYEKKPTKLIITRGVQTSGDGEYEKTIDINGMITYHSYFQIVDMRNDWMTNHYFRGHPKRSDMATLFWVDKKMPPAFNLSQKTDNVNDFYWTLNQTEIWVKKKFGSDKILQLAFKTFTPNFDHFEIHVDNSRGNSLTDSDWSWKLHHGNNRLSIYSVNKFGRKGIQSFVEVFVD